MKSSAFLIVVLLLFFILQIGCGTGDYVERDDQQGQPQPVSGAAGEVMYIIPEEWERTPVSSQMRKDQITLPGIEGGPAGELAVFFFPGTGGSVQANLDRWYGQFTQPDGSSTKEKAEVSKKNVNGLPVTIVSVNGTFSAGSGSMMGGPAHDLPGYKLLAAIVETSGGPWFFKATGPEKTIDYWLPSFDEFVNTFKIN
ncbi:hypothetical protein ACFL6I_27230 [candidate division KSB1 bacterium]